MAIKSNNVKGNPYHNESDGKFTSADSNSFGKLEDFLSSFSFKNGENFDSIDDFLNSFDDVEKIIPEPKNTIVDFKTTLNKLVTNKVKRELIINTLNKQLNLLPDNFKNIMLKFFEKFNIPINIKGNKTSFSYRMNLWSGNISYYELNVRQAEILNENNYNGHMTGTTIVHETFHAIDALTSNSWITSNKILSNGQTLKATLSSDVQNLDKGKMFNELLQEYENEKEQEFKKIANGKMEFAKAKELLAMKRKNIDEMNSALSIVNWKWKKGLFASTGDYVKEFNNVQEQFKNKLLSYKNEIDLVESINEQAKQQFMHKYTAICDMCESIDPNNAFTKEVGYGHGAKYWQKDNSNRVEEFFAECAEGMALNKESFAKFERYFPNAVNGFKEIIKYLEGEK